MAVKLRGLDRYEVEAIQYDGTNRRLYNGLNRRNQKNLENSLKISG